MATNESSDAGDRAEENPRDEDLAEESLAPGAEDESTHVADLEGTGEATDTGTQPQSLVDELTSMREEADAGEGATAESMSDGPIATSPPPSGFASQADAPPTRPYFGPITQIDDLPQTILQHLDQQSAANLQAAIRNPDADPDLLEQTSIRGLFSTDPRTSGDDEAPWYHTPLPPVRLEVVLVQYDWMVEKVIERAANRIDRVTESKMDSKINSAMFHLRSELRAIWR
jgi:hypothetical protein